MESPTNFSHPISSSGLKWTEQQLTPQPTGSSTDNHENKVILRAWSSLHFSKSFPYRYSLKPQEVEKLPLKFECCRPRNRKSSRWLCSLPSKLGQEPGSLDPHYLLFLDPGHIPGPLEPTSHLITGRMREWDPLYLAFWLVCSPKPALRDGLAQPQLALS